MEAINQLIENHKAAGAQEADQALAIDAQLVEMAEKKQRHLFKYQVLTIQLAALRATAQARLGFISELESLLKK